VATRRLTHRRRGGLRRPAPGTRPRQGSALCSRNSWLVSHNSSLKLLTWPV